MGNINFTCAEKGFLAISLIPCFALFIASFVPEHNIHWAYGFIPWAIASALVFIGRILRFD